MQMGPWLIAAMDILGSPAQLFSLLYLSLSDLLALPARNLRLALAYVRGSTPVATDSDCAAVGRGRSTSAAMRAAALVATLSTSGLRVALEAGYAVAAAGRRSASALHQYGSSLPFPASSLCPRITRFSTPSRTCVVE